MFSLEISDQGKRLDVLYSGHFDLSQGEQFCAHIQKLIPRLKKGFIIVADLSSLEYMDNNARPFIEKAMDILNSAGVSKVIRIVPDREKDIGFSIMSLFHYSSHVALHTFKSCSEAQAHLCKKSVG